MNVYCQEYAPRTDEISRNFHNFYKNGARGVEISKNSAGANLRAFRVYKSVRLPRTQVHYFHGREFVRLLRAYVYAPSVGVFMGANCGKTFYKCGGL